MSEIMSKRQEFAFLWDSPCPNKVVVAARGTGKTVATLQFVLEKLLTGAKNGRAVFFSSTLNQVKMTVVPIMRQLTINMDTNFVKYNSTDHIYRFFLDKDDVRELILLAYENPETKRGLHPQIIVLDECASMDANMFGNIISPMLTDTNGMMIAIGTPQGHNKFYELYKRGKSASFRNWESYCIKASKCKIFESEFLWAQRNSLTSAEYAQEYECDFDANVLVGSVYGEFMDRFTVNNIDDSYSWDPHLPVWVAWDLGYTDYTAMWFFQVKNDNITFIDYYEYNGQETTYYANYLLSKQYTYKKMILPHDGASKNIRGDAVASQLAKFGLRCEILPCRSEAEGIDEARKLLKVCKFNKKACAFGLERLKTFKFKIDKRTGLKTGITEHDESSHCADAFRYAAMSREIWNRSEYSGRIITRQDYSVLG